MLSHKCFCTFRSSSQCLLFQSFQKIVHILWPGEAGPSNPSKYIPRFCVTSGDVTQVAEKLTSTSNFGMLKLMINTYLKRYGCVKFMINTYEYLLGQGTLRLESLCSILYNYMKVKKFNCKGENRSSIPDSSGNIPGPFQAQLGSKKRKLGPI